MTHLRSETEFLFEDRKYGQMRLVLDKKSPVYGHIQQEASKGKWVTVRLATRQDVALLGYANIDLAEGA